MSQKPSIPKGTRDFSPAVMAKRNFIFENIRAQFKRFGFLPLETPAMENLSVLTGKYGEEGDQLIFKILNSGDFMKDLPESDFSLGYKKLTFKISEKALRYDLTVPFARYVVMNKNEIAFPFKRYQIQPVWRGDRPAKGRFREFYQCDADVVGTDSLVCEAEIIQLLQAAFKSLGLEKYSIKINNRKVLSGITEVIGKQGCEADFCVAIDKLDKIGMEAVQEELKQKGFEEGALKKLTPFFSVTGNTSEKLTKLKSLLADSETGKKGIAELEDVFRLAAAFKTSTDQVELDITLARGLSYYTGAIFEVKALGVDMGSICGGGRYDNLTGVFGLPGVSGVGISFGVDRIYEVMEELKLFPDSQLSSTKALITPFDDESFIYSLPVLYKLRESGINSEIFPEPAKMKKQLDYANKKLIPFVVIVGSEEIKSGKLVLKDMTKGSQQSLTVDEIITQLMKA